ncbi:MAG TPA: hypothetical protein VFG19_02765 [Geobacteraceae bacterium]|nr:hypothetical protein [Geobacteraceae bacterium]
MAKRPGKEVVQPANRGNVLGDCRRKSQLLGADVAVHYSKHGQAGHVKLLVLEFAGY